MTLHEIFINYRTGDGKETAHMCHRILTARFGADSVFLARKSIDAGANYIDVLLRTARQCRVLLALIGTNWLDAPDRERPERRALDNPADWVRREIEAALSSGALVVPVFIERRVEQLDPRRLPRSITELAECQYTRLELAGIDADLAHLGDRLVRQFPSLAALDTCAGESVPDTPDRDAGVRTDRQSGGIGQVGGSVGTFVNEAHAPFHAGRGNLYGGPHIEGDGTNYVVGDNHGGIRQGFGARPPRGGEGR
ncbi:toll/interleukin-1 receptor domain-containing protein [Streptomyces sp. PD-S100-1]|uniref:toll/interleukin-1 receptor domain-containing protein n=1 Tax=Streptomyces sp. PD-S100-1 TaxID=3394351 RepID=UPI0039BC8D14